MEVIRIFTIILTIVLGLAIGSFLNVVIYRLPNDMNLAKPASHCPKCNNPIKWYDNIPVFSYIFLRGKCRHCKEKISIRYPLIELLNAVLWFICLMMFTNFIIPSFEMNWLRFIVSLIISSTLICIFFIDLDYLEIHDVFQYILLICGLVLLLDKVTFENILLKVIGCLAAGALFLLIKYLFIWIKKEDGLGSGDIFLIANMGLILGGYKILFALILSCMIGGIVLVIIAAIKKNQGKQYPFAVLLVPGFIVSMFVGDIVVNLYLKLFEAI